MKLRTKCPNCGHEYIVDSSVIGLTLRCRYCNQEFTSEKISTTSSPPKSSAFHEKFDLPPKTSNSIRPNFVFNQQQSNVSSNFKNNPSADNHRENPCLKWIAGFFDFRTIVIPSFVRGPFPFSFSILASFWIFGSSA